MTARVRTPLADHYRVSLCDYTFRQAESGRP